MQTSAWGRKEKEDIPLRLRGGGRSPAWTAVLQAQEPGLGGVGVFGVGRGECMRGGAGWSRVECPLPCLREGPRPLPRPRLL